MKPTPKDSPESAPLLAFGAHPDDLEFGCGGVIARETQLGRATHLVVCSRGEAGTYGTPAQRTLEAEQAAALLGASLEFIELDGDAHLEVRVAHTIKLAGIIRRLRPGIVLAPSPAENQHPDHYRLGTLVRDATRLARYGGVAELRAANLPSHAIRHLLFYALTPESEPAGITPILVDVSAPDVVGAWTSAMEAHASQTSARSYVKLQLTRAQLHGLRAGIEYAIPLFPNDPLVVTSLAQLTSSTRSF